MTFRHPLEEHFGLKADHNASARVALGCVGAACLLIGAYIALGIGGFCVGLGIVVLYVALADE